MPQSLKASTNGEVISMYLDRLNAAASEVNLAQQKIRDLLKSTGRHGDLLVIHGALERAKSSVRYLIDSEEHV